MSGNSDKFQLHGSAAPSASNDFFQSAPPPPSYEESLNMSERTPHQYTYSNPTPYQQQQALLPPPSYTSPGPSQASYGYDNPYQAHIQQQQSFYNSTYAMPQAGSTKAAENVIYLAKGAKVRTTASGAISIPPPPPGCSPTPGQLAAMSGQPVMIKKQKKPFF